MTLNKLSTLVIEDEDEVRETLIQTLNESLEFTVVGETGFANEAVELIIEHRPDVIFMDIKLRGGEASQVIRKLEGMKVNIPPIIINTGFTEFDYAQSMLNDFGHCVVYILKKPFWNDWQEREAKIVDAISNFFHDRRHKENLQLQVMPIRAGSQTFFIKPEEIRYLNVENKGSGKVSVTTLNTSFELNKSLLKTLQELPQYIFQISRYTAVNLQHLERIDSSERTLYLKCGSYFSIGESFYQKLAKLLPMK